MKLASLKVGLHLTLHSIPYRINRIIESDLVELERVSDLALVRRQKSELLMYLSNGELRLTGGEVPAQPVASEVRASIDVQSLPPKDQSLVMRKYEYVTSCIKAMGTRPSCTKDLDLIIERVAERLDDENKPSKGTVYRWWKQYNSSSRNLMALADKKSGKEGCRAFSDIVLNELNVIINKVYLQENKPCKREVYRQFKHRMNELNLARVESLRYPSEPHFYRLIGGLNKYDEMAAREGKRVADEYFRTSGAGPIVRHILERVEVDHTPLDVMAVNPETGKVEGRPNLTLIIDVYSRLILGIYIGFEPPSQLSVMRALRNAILPKNMEEELYEGVENAWLAHGLPTTLICDNGLEFHSDALQRLCGELGIDLQFCPKIEPNYKPVVERTNGTINRQVCHNLPGTTFSDIEHRGDYKSEEKACLSLEEIRTLIYRWIIDIYNQQVHSTTKRVPAKLWEEGLQIVEPMLPESIHHLNLSLTMETQRTLTHKGIEIFNQFYNASSLRAMRERREENYEVTIRYDEEDIGSIWIFDDLNSDFIRVPSTNCEYAEGLSLRQHRYIRKNLIDKGLGEQNEKAVLEHRAKLREAIEQLKSEKLVSKRRKAARLDQPSEDRSSSISSTDKVTAPDSDIELEMYELVPEFEIDNLEAL